MNLSSLFIPVKEPVNSRQPGFRKLHDELSELFVKFVFNPGNVVSFFPYPIIDAGKSYLQRVIEKENRVTIL